MVSFVGHSCVVYGIWLASLDCADFVPCVHKQEFAVNCE